MVVSLSRDGLRTLLKSPRKQRGQGRYPETLVKIRSKTALLKGGGCIGLPTP